MQCGWNVACDVFVFSTHLQQPRMNLVTAFEMTLSPQSAEAEPRSRDEIVNQLAKPLTGSTIQRVIRNLSPAKHTSIQRSVHSSVGTLDVLPIEVLSMILDMLDFQSLSRLSRTSLLARSIIEQLPVYSDMISYAPETLTALQRTGLLSYHSALQLRRTLCSEKCASCTHFGGYLFLPTCERACFDCLRYNYALRVTTVAIAKRCFHLSDLQLKRIPIMLSIPGTYSMGCEINRNRVYRLVGVKQAKELAMMVHGSVEALKDLSPELFDGTIPTGSSLLMRRFHEATLEPPEQPLYIDKYDVSTVVDDYGGMAVVRFPALYNGELDFGNLCLGCEVTNKEYQRGDLPSRVLSELSTPFAHCHPNHALYSIINRLWSKSGFLQHIKECYGVERLLKKWDK